jgi:hypothetical protein
MTGYPSPTTVGRVVFAGVPSYTKLGAVLPRCRTEVCMTGAAPPAVPPVAR